VGAREAWKNEGKRGKCEGNRGNVEGKTENVRERWAKINKY
jgi:hypothetical protein